MELSHQRVSLRRVAALVGLAAVDGALLGWALASMTTSPIGEFVRLGAVGACTALGTWILLSRRTIAPSTSAALSTSGPTAETRPEPELEPGLVFSGRLARALDRTSSPDELRAVLGDALARMGTARAELLVASQADGLLETIAGTQADRLCPVSAASDCPAISHGRSLGQDHSDELDACPHLKNRVDGPHAALCVPVFVGGTTLGVVHTLDEAGRHPHAETIAHVESYATHAGPRVSPFMRGHSDDILDPLTGLINRTSAERRIRLLVEQLAPFTIAVADIDSMSLVNQQHGHEAGDRVIRLFSDVLTLTLRPDDVVSRYGGEEFVLIFPHTSTLDVSSALERVRERLALRLTEGDVIPFTASFGVADSNQADSIEELILTADDALLLAKQRGRNRVVIAGEETYRELFEDQPGLP
ncbi:MAG: GGDEF domain-containing protein [Actinomycetia bacterium]|nr:GGDEF domain-containing protein [Actinomycetes bacterium]